MVNHFYLLFSYGLRVKENSRDGVSTYSLALALSYRLTIKDVHTLRALFSSLLSFSRSCIMSKQLSCGVEFMRAALLILNILFVFIGLGLIGFGIYARIDSGLAAVLTKLTNVSSFEGQSLGFLAFVLIGGGVFILLIAFFGCMGK